LRAFTAYIIEDKVVNQLILFEFTCEFHAYKVVYKTQKHLT